MNYQDEVARSLIRASAFRALRHAPLWVAIIILIIGFLLGVK